MKLKNIILEIEKETAALEFLSNLVKNGPFKNRVFLAGGSPRDMQLGIKPKDLDVVVKGDINAGIDFATWAAKEIGNYKDHSNPVIYPTYGTAKFTLQGVTYKGHDLSDVDVEAVAPRKEKYTAGSRKPEVSGGELEDDVQRRDFTVNSLLHDLTTGETLDLTGMGKDDIKAGIVRTPLNPDIIFTDDPLRILRAVRFTAKYNWKLPMFMIRAIKKHAPQLSNISKERIHDETNKMLLTNYPFKAFRLLQILGLMKYVFPSLQGADLEYMKKMKDLKGDIVLRLVAAHHQNNPDKVRLEMNNLRYSSDKINSVIKTLKNLPTFMVRCENPSDEYLRVIAYTASDIGPLLMEFASVYNEKFNYSDVMRRYSEVLKQLHDNPLPVSGDDLISLGMKPGPEFKGLLDKFKLMYLKNPNTPKDEYLRMVSK